MYECDWCVPFVEELQDVVLALLREPCLTRDEEVDLREVSLQDLRCEGGDEVLGERSVALLELARHLRWVAKAVEQAAKSAVRPLLRLPPLGALSLVLVFGHSVLWYLELHDLEQKTTPGDKGLGALLVLAQEEDDRG